MSDTGEQSARDAGARYDLGLLFTDGLPDLDDSAGYRGTVAADGSVGWTAFPNSVNSMMTGAWGSSPNDVWAVGSAGAIRHWDGTAWTLSKLAVADIPMWQDLTSVHGGPAGDVWAVGNGVALHRAPKSLGGTP